MPNVLNIKATPDWRERVARGEAIYIGRANGRYRLAASVFHNPFPVRRESERASSLGAYRQHLEDRPDLMERLPELRGKDLLCWCAPKPCHGDLLLELANP